MCRTLGKTVAVVFIFCIAACCAWGGECAKNKNAETTKSCNAPDIVVSKLLKGVVHLSDNDIRLRDASGTCVFVDPVSGSENDMVKKSEMTKPDLILITHSHDDHFQPAIIQEYLKINPNAMVAGPKDVVESLKGNQINASLVSPNQKYNMANLDFRTVPAYFDDEKYNHPKSNRWVGYILYLNNAKYYISGDTQPIHETKTHADVIFPLLYGCGGNIDGAVEMTKLSKARLAVPVHHSGKEKTIKQYISKLPEDCQGVYYLNCEFVASPAAENQNKTAGEPTPSPNQEIAKDGGK